MNLLKQNYVISILVGLVVILPFFILQLIATSGYPRGFPLTLFIALWVISGVFTSALMSALTQVREKTVKTEFVWFASKMLLLALFGSAWINLILDQMPCFLGGSGC